MVSRIRHNSFAFGRSFRRLIILFITIISFVCVAPAQQSSYNLQVTRDDGRLYLNIQSREVFPSLGYSIKTKYYWSKDTLVVEMIGFVQPEPGVQGTDVARTSLPLIVLPTKDFYILVLDKQASNLWKLLAAQDGYTPVALRKSFTSFFR